MRIGFLGAGRLGTAFGRCLADEGVTVAGYLSRSPESARRAAELTGSLAFTDPVALAQACDHLALTTPDDQIGPTAEQLAGLPLPDGLHVLHMSGALPSQVLQALRDAGHPTSSLHPLQSLGGADDARALHGCTWSLEGDPAPELEAFVTSLGSRVLRVDARQKAMLHVAAVLSCGGVTGLLHVAGRLVDEATGSPGTGLDALLPLLHHTVDRIGRSGCRDALTGPAARGDQGTIVRHRELLADHGDELVAQLYDQLTTAMLDLAAQPSPVSSPTHDRPVDQEPAR